MTDKKTERRDRLLKGNPAKGLFLFAVPLILGNLFQQFYNMTDSIIVGNFVGEDALAAVGASYALTNVFIMIAIGGGNGASVLTAQYLGAGQYGRMKTSISTSCLTFLALSIFLGGFSMGAAMSLYSSVRQVRTLAGCIALSGYFPAADLLEKDVTPAGRGTPVFMAHGAFDSVIPSVLAEHGADLLENTLDTLIWREYNIDHEICQDELMNVAQFMSTALQR